MAVNTTSELRIGDIVTHTGKRGFWDVDKSYKGVGLIMSPLYKLYDRKYVHDVWFTNINQLQQIGAKALVRINKEEQNYVERTR